MFVVLTIHNNQAKCRQVRNVSFRNEESAKMEMWQNLRIPPHTYYKEFKKPPKMNFGDYHDFCSEKIMADM